MMDKKYNMKELERLLAVCSATFYNLNGFLPDTEELCRQIGTEYRPAIYRILGGSMAVSPVLAV
jgi:hypothetical protein